MESGNMSVEQYQFYGGSVAPADAVPITRPTASYAVISTSVTHPLPEEASTQTMSQDRFLDANFCIF